VSPGIYEDPRFQEGAFGLLDTNIGDVIPAINAGWNIVCLPVFTKRKPLLNYLWVRSDRAITSPKDLEGKTLATSGWGVVTTLTRQYLQHFHGVDVSKLRWVAGGPGRWDLYKPVQVEYPSDRKRQERRLLDGETDGCTGDITDAKAWAELENSPDKVQRLFPNYRQMHRQMFKENGIYTPAHIMVMGGKLNQEQPGLARKIFAALEQSREMAYADALGDGTTYSLIMDARELVRDQRKELGDPHRHGIKAQKSTIDLLLDAYYEQGQTRKRLSVEEVFAESTLDT
jgi:4,5-dihydroxyphthalate decarboxylase